MNKYWEHNKAYNFCKPYVLACIRMSYRKFEISGLENYDPEVPTVFVGNHSATLMDPLVVLYSFPKDISFGARADIFRKKRIADILHWMKMMPLARSRDGRDAVEGNYAIFDEITEGIVNGVPFCLFPEGTHHADTKLYPFKKGAARLAQMAAEKSGKEVNIIPFGIKYSSFFDFMTDVTIEYGKPIRMNAESNLMEITQQCFDAVSVLAHYDEAAPKATGKAAKAGKIAGGIALAPLFLISLILALPILIPEAIILRKIKDKAWSNTVRFGCALLLFLFWPAHSLFHLINNYYKTIL